jgi:hypothetical protein
MWIAKNRRSNSYIGTIKDRDDPMLDVIRKEIKTVNKNPGWSSKYRVKLHGRRPIVKLPRWQLQEIPLDLSSHIDIYIYRGYR